MSDRLAQIRKRIENATPGPWEVEAMDAGHSRLDMVVWIVHAETGDQICDLDGYTRIGNEKYATDDGWADAQFIVHAREDLEYLLSLVDLLQQQVNTKIHEAQCTCWRTGLPLSPIMVNDACPVHRTYTTSTTTFYLTDNTKEIRQ